MNQTNIIEQVNICNSYELIIKKILKYFILLKISNKSYFID